MKAILAKLTSVKTCTIVLSVLILANVSMIVGYALWSRKDGLNSSAVTSQWTSYGVVLEAKEREGLSPSLRERNEVSMKKSLIEDMRRCSLAMGMTGEELNASMSNLTMVAAKAQMFLNALQSIVPANYLKETKNPCWNSNLSIGSRFRMALMLGLRGRLNRLLKFSIRGLFHMSTSSTQLYCLPYFFIAGYPKSGTTTLHEALQHHPRIVSPTSKEPHWWTRVPLEDMDMDYLQLTVMEYLLYFSNVANKLAQHRSEGVITYDGSQSTLWDSNYFMDNEDFCAMPAVISRILPNAKFIVLMRNPITREYSNYFYSCGSNLRLWPKNVQNDPAREFHKAVQADTSVFTNCQKRTNNSLHKCLQRIRSIKNGCRSGHIGKRLPISLYYIHLHKWLKFYPRENFLFLRTEDMCTQSLGTMTKITNFLEVESVSEDQAREWLCREANAQKVYFTDPEKFKMRPETEKLLEGFYRPFNLKLAELTGSEHFLWDSKH